MALPALLDRALMRPVKLPVLKPVRLPPLYHCGGSCTMFLNAFAQVRSTPNAIA